MAEVLWSFDTLVETPEGSYAPRVIGRQAGDGLWEGWLEFIPVEEGTPVLATGVETRQPERAHLRYWATGLTPVYLEGAFRRARDPVMVTVSVEPPPATAAPAPRPVRVAAAPPPVEPILNPFEIGARSLDVLRQELGALDRPRLLNIIAAYDLNAGGSDPDWMTDAQLVTFIVTAVEAILVQRG